MKTNIRLVLPLFCTLVALTISNQCNAQSNKDEALVKETVLNYIEGWYGADTVRMSKALSPDLKKRGILFHHKTSNLTLIEASYSQMLEWTSKKPNEMQQKPEISVSIIEIGTNIAMAKSISPQFVDYIHLGKMNGEWKIYNVLWEPKK